MGKKRAYACATLMTDNGTGAAWEDVVSVTSLVSTVYDVAAYISANVNAANDAAEYRLVVNGAESAVLGRLRGKDSEDLHAIITWDNVYIPKGNTAVLQQIQIAGLVTAKATRTKIVIKES